MDKIELLELINKGKSSFVELKWYPAYSIWIDSR